MEILSDINTWIWNEHTWLPFNTSWNDFRDTSTVKYAQFSDLNNGFTVALALLIVRYILEQYVFSFIGQYLGLKSKIIKEVHYDITEKTILEKAFSENGRFTDKQIQGLAKQLDWSERRVERWIRGRISLGKRTKLSKFTESAWKFSYHLSSVCFGFYALWDKTWFWKSSYFWQEYPNHSLSDDIWWYYMLQVGYYLSLNISQFWDTKRKDFLEMLVHHFLTILLLTFSWRFNFFRIGSYLSVILDIAHVPLEFAKMAIYVEHKRVADASFVVFTVTWIITRLVIYPYRILYSTMYEAILTLPKLPAYYVFNSLLCALQVLQIVWTWMIVKVALRTVSSKKPGVKDLRSDSDGGISSSCENDAGDKNTSSQSNNASSQRAA